VAFAVAIWLAVRRAKRVGANPELVFSLCVWVLIGGLLGGKILLLLVDIRYYLANPSELATVWRLGGVYLGGLLGGLVVGWWYIRRHEMGFWRTADILAPSIALATAIGRVLGCFMAGCCYGRPTDVAWAVVFHNEYSHRMFGTPIGVPIHPTQLYNSLANLVNFIILTLKFRKRRFEGQIFLLYCIIYSAGRFVTEFYRGDPRGSVFSGLLSTSQFLGILIFSSALAAYLFLRRRQKRV